MVRVLLVHPGAIPHYRIAIYGYLSGFLAERGYDLHVTSDTLEPGHSHSVKFRYTQVRLSTAAIVGMIRRESIDAVIDFMGLRNLYLFPTYAIGKGVLRRKFVYWGQGRDLLASQSILKNIGYALEQALCDAIILYSESLRPMLPAFLRKKAFVAPNTLYIDYPGLPAGVTRDSVLARYGITTRKNIICVGRMQKRKRIEQAVAALALLSRPDIGLILVGPDSEGVLSGFDAPNIYKLPALYGNEKFDLLFSSDLFCLPGAVGLSIVDAFYAGLPLVTEEGDPSAEAAYLKNGINGFVVPRGDVRALASKLLLLLDDDTLRLRFSIAAASEIADHANIDDFCEGFYRALNFAMTGKQ
ncbi:MAG: glycosyltransferase family 4 protein [Burkholderiales bacterium]